MSAVDAMADVAHSAATREVIGLLKALSPNELTGLEIAGLLVILRGARERLHPRGVEQAESRATVLRLVPR